jgi:hypothetical protein
MRHFGSHPEAKLRHSSFVGSAMMLVSILNTHNIIQVIVIQFYFAILVGCQWGFFKGRIDVSFMIVVKLPAHAGYQKSTPLAAGNTSIIV